MSRAYRVVWGFVTEGESAMLRSIRSLFVSAGAMAFCAAASASTTFVATLTTDQETVATHPTFTGGAPRVSGGTATFVLNDAQDQLTMNATITGIDVNGTQTPT